MKEDTRLDGPWEFGECPKVNSSKDSVKKARERRAELNKEIHEKGAIKAMQEGLISYKDVKAVHQAAQLIDLLEQEPQD